MSNEGQEAPSVVPQTLCATDAARYIGVSPHTLQAARSHGNREGRAAMPPAVKCGRKVMYRIKDLDAWLDSLQKAG